MTALTIDISDLKTKTPQNVLTRLSAYQQQQADPSLLAHKLEKAAQHKQHLQDLRRQQKEEFKLRKQEARSQLLKENVNSQFRFKLRLLTKVDDSLLKEHLDNQRQRIEAKQSEAEERRQTLQLSKVNKARSSTVKRSSSEQPQQQRARQHSRERRARERASQLKQQKQQKLREQRQKYDQHV